MSIKKICIKKEYNIVSFISTDHWLIDNNPKYVSLIKSIWITLVYPFLLLLVHFVFYSTNTYKAILPLDIRNSTQIFYLIMGGFVAVYWNVDKKHDEKIRYISDNYNSLLDIDIKTKVDEKKHLKREAAFALDILHYNLWNDEQFNSWILDVIRSAAKYKFRNYKQKNKLIEKYMSNLNAGVKYKLIYDDLINYHSIFLPTIPVEKHFP